MAFLIRPEEDPNFGIRRILQEQLGDILRLLDAKESSIETKVHDTRRSLKKIRAVLRLVRGTLPKKRFQVENSRFRDMGRAIAEVRDADVSLQTFQKCLPHLPPIANRQEIEKCLREKRRVALSPFRRPNHPLAKLRLQVAPLVSEVKTLPLNADGWRTYRSGIRQTYKRCCGTYAEARSQATDLAFHEWRKQVKYLRYQIQILRKPWPSYFDLLETELHRLSDLLGEDHDLVVLKALVTREERNQPRRACEAFSAWITQQQRELRRKALLAGERLFAESPKAFEHRLHQYWSAAGQARTQPHGTI